MAVNPPSPPSTIPLDELINNLKNVGNQSSLPKSSVKVNSSLAPTSTGSWKTGVVAPQATKTAGSGTLDFVGKVGLKGVGKVFNNPVVKNIIKPIALFSTPGRALVSTVTQLYQEQDTDPTTGFTFDQLLKDAKNFTYGAGDTLKIPGWKGRFIGFGLDMALDPINYATLGATIAPNAALKVTVGGIKAGTKTRAAFGLKNIATREGRNVLARFTSERMVQLKNSGVKTIKYGGKDEALTDGFIQVVQKNIAAGGKRFMPGAIKSDLGIQGPGIYYFGSRIRVPGSGLAGRLIEAGVSNTRLGFVKPIMVGGKNINPGSLLQAKTIARGTGAFKELGEDTVANLRIGLANNTFSPQEADRALALLHADTYARIGQANALEAANQEIINVVGDKAIKLNAQQISQVMEGTITGTPDQVMWATQISNIMKKLRDRFEAYAVSVEPTFKVGTTENYLPFMEADELAALRVKYGDKAVDDLMGYSLDSKRMGANYRGRRTKAGDTWFGHTLTEDQLNTTTLNRLAATPADTYMGKIILPEGFKALETDVQKVLAKYVENHSRSYHPFLMLEDLLTKSPNYARRVIEDLPKTPTHATADAAEFESVFHSKYVVAADLLTELKNSLDAVKTRPLSEQPEALSIALEQVKSLRTKFESAQAAVKEYIDNPETSLFRATENTELAIADSNKRLDEIQTELNELITSKAPQDQIAAKAKELENQLQDTTSIMSKYLSDAQQLRDVHNNLPSPYKPIDFTKGNIVEQLEAVIAQRQSRIGPSLRAVIGDDPYPGYVPTPQMKVLTPEPQIKSVVDGGLNDLVEATVSPTTLRTMEDSLKYILNRHHTREFTRTGQSSLLSQIKAGAGKAQSSKLAEKITIIQSRLKVLNSKYSSKAVKNRKQVEALYIEKTKLVYMMQDVLHQTESMNEYNKFVELYKYYGITIGDDIIDSIFERNKKVFYDTTWSRTHRLLSIRNLLDRIDPAIRDTIDKTAQPRTALLSLFEDDELLKEVLVDGAALSKELDEILLGLPLETKLTDIANFVKRIIEQERLRLETVSNLGYGRNNGTGVFGSFNPIETVLSQSKEVQIFAQKAIGKESQLGFKNVTKEIETQLKKFDPTVGPVFRKYLSSLTNNLKVIRNEIQEIINPALKKAQQNLSDFTNKHLENSLKYKKEISKISSMKYQSHRQYVEAALRKSFDDPETFWNNFQSENKYLFQLSEEILSQKNGIMLTQDAFETINILKQYADYDFFQSRVMQNFSEDLQDYINLQQGLSPDDIERVFGFSFPTDLTYEKLNSIVFDLLNKKVLSQLDDSVAGSKALLEGDVLFQQKELGRAQLSAARIFKKRQTLTPDDFIRTDEGADLVAKAMGIDRQTAKSLISTMPDVAPDSQTLVNAQKEIASLTESDYYPIAKSIEKRVNTIHALKELNGSQVDWTLGGVLQALHRGQPLSFRVPELWSILINGANISTVGADEIISVVKWVQQPQVLQTIFTPEELAKFGSKVDEIVAVERFVKYVKETKPAAVASKTVIDARAASIQKNWLKSNAHTHLKKIQELNNVVIAANIDAQQKNSVRLMEISNGLTDEAIALNRANIAKAGDWADAQASAFDADIEEMFARHREMMDSNEFIELTEQTRPRKNIGNQIKELDLKTLKTSKQVIRVADSNPEYERLLRSGVPKEILDGPLVDLNSFLRETTNNIEKRVGKFNVAADKVRDILSEPLDGKTAEQIKFEIKLLEQVKIEGLEIPGFKNITNEIRARNRILQSVENDLVDQGPVVPLLNKYDEIKRMEESGLYTKAEINIRRTQLEQRLKQKIEFRKELRLGPKPDIEIGEFDTPDVNLAAIDVEDVPSSTLDRSVRVTGSKVTQGPKNAPRNRPTSKNNIPLGSEPYDELEKIMELDLRPISSSAAPIAAKNKLIEDLQQGLTRTQTQIQKMEDSFSSVGLKTPPNNATLDDVEKKIEGVVDLLTSINPDSVQGRILNGAAKEKFIADFFDGKEVVSGPNKAAADLLKDARDAIKLMRTQGNITIEDELFIDQVKKFADFIYHSSRMTDEVMEARMMAGLSSPGMAVGGVKSLPEMIEDEFVSGWKNLGGRFSSIEVEEGVKAMWENAGWFQNADNMNQFKIFVAQYNQLHKTYATATPGFHVRNGIGNGMQLILAGAKIKNIKIATDIHFAWLKAYKQQISWDDFVENYIKIKYTPEIAESAIIGRQAMHGSGGGLYGELRSTVAPNKTMKFLLHNKAATKLQSLGQTSDNYSRFVLGFDSGAQGATYEMATVRVRRFFFDYEDLSSLDRAVKNFVPFWIWSSRNFPLQVENMWMNPKPYSIYDKVRKNVGENKDEDELPDYLKEIGAFKLNLGGTRLYAAPDLGFSRVNQQYQQIINPIRYGTNLTPLLRLPIEQILGRNLYNDTKIENDPVARLAHLLKGGFVPIATGDRIFNSYGIPQDNAYLSLFGSPIKRYS